MQLHSSLYDVDVKFPFGTVYGGRKHRRTNFSFSFKIEIFLNLYAVLKNSTPEKFTYI